MWVNHIANVINDHLVTRYMFDDAEKMQSQHNRTMQDQITQLEEVVGFLRQELKHATNNMPRIHRDDCPCSDCN